MRIGLSRTEYGVGAAVAGGGGVACGGADGRAVSAPPQPLQNLLEPSFLVPQAAQNTIVAPHFGDLGLAQKGSAPANALDGSQTFAAADQWESTAE